MKLLKPCVVFCLIAMALALVSRSLHAAECADVFASDINSNLGADGLNLTGVPWGSDSWPTSGSTLTTGDYYFSGTTLGNNYSLSIASGEQVRIFVSGSLNMGPNVDLNANGDPGQLLIAVQGNLVFGNNAEFNGLVYAGGSIGRSSPGGGSAPDIQGAVAAAGAIDLRAVDVDYESGLVNSSLLTGLCDRNIVLSANGVDVGPVEVTAGATVSFSVDARNCPAAEGAAFDSEWVDQWTVGGAVEDQFGYEGSPCDRSVAWSRTFTEPGEYPVEYVSYYCSDNGVFNLWCRGYSEFDRDQIIIRVREEFDGLNCETQDDFDDGPLDQSLWVTSRSNGEFTPSVVEPGRLRMTEAKNNQATAATLQAEIPGDGNLVILRFNYYAYGGSGADGIAVVLSDARITPQPGSYGGSLGYAQRTGASGGDGFAGGWLGIGIDEYGNFASQSEGREGGRPNGRTPQSVSIRGSGEGADGYSYLAGTPTLSTAIDSTGQSNAHTYEIRMDSTEPGTAFVSVSRDTGSGMETLIPRFDVLDNSSQAAVPENLLLSITGSTGGSTNVHELDDLELCALKINKVGAQVHHFEIEHDGVALTCQGEENIVIRACANADCSEQFTDPVEADMTPSGWVGGNTVMVNNGESTATLKRTTKGTVELGVIGSRPSTRPQSVTLCRSGNSGLSPENCNLRFYDTGLVFDVPDMVANEGQSGIDVRAVRTEGSPEQACVPAFRGEKRSVRFWSSYINPVDGNLSATPAVQVQGEEISGSAFSPTSILLDFDSNGVASIDVNYPDAGRLQLDASYVGSEATDDQGLVMPGADQFVSKPVGFCIEATSPDAACDSPLANCSVLTAAGDSFDLRLRAVASDPGGNENLCVNNSVTRNFRATLDLDHSLIAPPPSEGTLGNVGVSQARFGQSADGEVTIQQSVSEVGVFRFGIVSGQSYLGTALPGGSSRDVGRFTPASLEMVEATADHGVLQAGCAVTGSDDIHYIGQPMRWYVPPSFQIRALNRQGGITENYTWGGFLKLEDSDLKRVFPSADLSQTTSDNSSLVSTDFDSRDGSITSDSPGVMDYTFSVEDAIWYRKNPEARVGAFSPSLEFELTSLEDSDGVDAPSLPYPFIAGLAVDPDTGSGFKVRYGRLVLDNVYGPENLEELLLPVRLEEWTGSNWQARDGGACIPSDLTAITDAAETSSDHHTLDASGLIPGTGSAEYYLRLVPDGSRGSDTLRWPLSSGADLDSGEVPGQYDWLMDFWGRDPDPDALQSPEGIATFGVYRGSDRIIYWREATD